VWRRCHGIGHKGVIFALYAVTKLNIAASQYMP